MTSAKGQAWRLDVESGRLWSDDPEGVLGEDRPGLWEDRDRWVELTSLGSRRAWEDMAEFTERVEDAELADRLDRAVRGKGVPLLPGRPGRTRPREVDLDSAHRRLRAARQVSALPMWLWRPPVGPGPWRLRS